VNPSSRLRLSVAWLAVVAVTVGYVVIDRSVDRAGPAASTAASVAAVGIALAKLRIVLREFMDVRHAPKALRTATDALVVGMGVVLLGTYLVGRMLA
jgi:Prokaryotic Cytochrome C oxidase subunit IV